MKKNVVTLLCFALFGLSTGCTSSKWHQDGKTAEEMRADLAQCRKWVEAADVAFTIDSTKTKSELVSGCMKMKGYAETGKTNSLTE